MVETIPVQSAIDDTKRLKFLEEYNRRRPQYERVLTQLLSLLEEYRRIRYSQPKLRVHSVRGRVKTSSSLETKALRPKNIVTLDPSLVFAQIHDIVGARIVCNTLDGKAAACAWVEQLEKVSHAPLRIRENEDKLYETGYRSRHFLIQLVPAAWPALGVDASDGDECVIAELQVRTLLEEAWGEIEHDLRYKTPNSRPLDGQSGSILKSGFVGLSHRLHDADTLVERLTKRVVDEPERSPASRIAQEMRSLSVDTHKLDITDSSLFEKLDRELGNAEEDRLAGRHEDAYKKHAALQQLAELSMPCTQSVLLSEMGLDRLLAAQTLLDERSANANESAASLLDEAWNFYEHALAKDPEGNGAIFLWRQSRIRALQERKTDAKNLMLRALEILEKNGKPKYIRTPFYKAAIKARIGILLHKQYEKLAREDGPAEKHAELLKDAMGYLTQAVGDQRDAKGSGGRPPREWMLDNLDARNNLAWVQLRCGDPNEADETLRLAKEEVDPSIWEQDVHFLDTMLGIELALLPNVPSFDEMVRIDSLRVRILTILFMPGTHVPRENVDTMLDNIAQAETRLREAVLAFGQRQRPPLDPIPSGAC
jgi:ppGpp synthetase/RelA/SpoT-type nucleotidyltranferase